MGCQACKALGILHYPREVPEWARDIVPGPATGSETVHLQGDDLGEGRLPGEERCPDVPVRVGVAGDDAP